MAVIPEATIAAALSPTAETLAQVPPLEKATEVEVDAPGANTPDALVETLGDLSYSGLFPEKEISLKDGYYEYSEGGIGTPHIHLIDRQIVLGDLNEDGAQDAVILLEDDSEGTARFTFLVAVLNVLTDPMPVEAIMLGDRIGVKSLAVDGTQVVAEVVAQGMLTAAQAGMSRWSIPWKLDSWWSKAVQSSTGSLWTTWMARAGG
jgi:hypothetical protein